MNILKKRVAQVTYPTGKKSFAVFQAFPAGLTAEEADPFLMCDHFGPTIEQNEPSEDPDEFPVGWHPHRGIDICTYLTKGVGRHADSLGNRGSFCFRFDSIRKKNNFTQFNFKKRNLPVTWYSMDFCWQWHRACRRRWNTERRSDGGFSDLGQRAVGDEDGRSSLRHR